MPPLHKFRAIARAITFQTAFKPDDSPVLHEAKKKNRTNVNQHVSLELIRHLTMSTDYSSPFILASNGDLDGLKYINETFGNILKEQDKHCATTLHYASSANQIEVMQYLINSGMELNNADMNGNTALHVATLQQHVEATSLLLNSGIDDKIINMKGDAGLHIAVRSNNTNLITVYLGNSNVDLHVKGYRHRTPLHVIAEYDYLEACKLYHHASLKQEYKGKKGYCLCSTDEDNLTPVHLAARKGSHKVLNFFIKYSKQYGYSLEDILGFFDEENSTPLHAAIDGGHTKVVEVLLMHGANPVGNKELQVPPFLMACSQGRLEVIEMIVNHCHFSDIISCRDMYGQSCLHFCTHPLNSSQIISFLISKGADVNAVDNKGQTPLIFSTIIGYNQGIPALLERGADVFIKDVDGNNAMQHALMHKRKKILELFLELPMAGDLALSVNNKGQSSIHTALTLGLSDLANPIVDLIKHNVNNIKDGKGNNCLHLAAKGGNWKAITILLDIKECIKLLNEIDNNGMTPLHYAAQSGSLRCVELLLSYGAMIHRCHRGSTPFMNACIMGHSEVARLLFDTHPFQLDWTTDMGDSSLHLATRSRNPQMITMLLDIGISIVHNNKQESFFDMIIQNNELRCAAAVIQHSRYHEALDLVSPVHQHPMIDLIAYMPEIAKQVLDHSHSKSELAHQNPDYWEKYDFKYLCLNDGGNLQKENKGSLLKNTENNPIKSTTINYKRRPSKTEHLPHLIALKTMVKFNRSTLLTHPLCDAFFKKKWRCYGRYTILLVASHIFLQILFTVLFTALILHNRRTLTTFTQTNSSTIFGNGTNGINGINETNGTVKGMEFWYGVNISRFIALSLAAIALIFWIILVIKIRLEALDLINHSYVFIDLLSVIFTIYYLIPTRGFDNAYFQAGAIASFFSWFSLVLILQLFDAFGVYITMLLTIIRTVVKVFIICFLFIMAFSISLFILAGNLTQYSSIGYSIFVNLGHLLGELEYEAFVNEDVNGNLENNKLTFIFVSTIAIFMGIVIVNLLIGIAVGDIEQIRKNSIMGKKVVEVSFYFIIDSILSSRILSKFDMSSYTKYPNKKANATTKFLRAFWHYLKSQNQSIVETQVNPAQEVGINCKNEDFFMLKEKLDEIALQQERIMEILDYMQKKNVEHDHVCQ